MGSREGVENKYVESKLEIDNSLIFQGVFINHINSYYHQSPDEDVTLDIETLGNSGHTSVLNLNSCVPMFISSI